MQPRLLGVLFCLLFLLRHLLIITALLLTTRDLKLGLCGGQWTLERVGMTVDP